MLLTGHESNGCPQPRTTESKSISHTDTSRMVALTLTKPNNATIAKVLGTSRRTARLYVLVVPVPEVDAVILVANRVI